MKGLAQKTAISLLAIVLGLIAACICIYFMGISPIKAMQTFFKTFSGDLYGLSEIFVKALPLLFTGLSYAFANRCGLVNLGAEGQLYMGALFATIIATRLNGLPMMLHLPLTILAGFLGGAIIGVLAGFLKARFGVLEVLSTLMINYVAEFFVSYMVTGPIKESTSTPQSAPFPETARLPILIEGTRLHAGIIVGLLCIGAFYLVIAKSTFGFRIRTVGDNPSAAHYAGINVNRNCIYAMAIAGGFGGLAGAVELSGVLGRLYEGFSPGWGWDGISVALLGNCNAFGTGIASMLMGFIRAGVNSMQRSLSVPIGIVYVVQAVIILCIICKDYRPKILRNRLSAPRAARKGA